MKRRTPPVPVPPNQARKQRFALPGGLRLEAPLCLTGATLMMVVFYAVFPSGLLRGTVLARYFTHPVEHVTTALFFVAVAVLALRWWRLFREASALRAMAAAGQGAGGVAALERLTGEQRQTEGARRLRAALSALSGVADRESFQDYLLRGEDAAFEATEAGYKGVKVIQWCIPIVGFLGTVVGITAAIANLSPQNLEQSMALAIEGLSTAFDTTALALALSLVLAPVIHAVSQRHHRITDRISEVLRSILKAPPAEPRSRESLDQLAAAIRQQTERVGDGFAELQRHTETMGREVADRLTEASRAVSRQAAESVGEAVSTSAGAAADRVAQAVAGTSGEILARFEASWAEAAGNLKESSQELLRAFTANWEPALGRLQTVAGSFDALAEGVQASAEAVEQHNAVLGEAVGMTREVVDLEESLNRNLTALEAMETWRESQTALTATLAVLQGSVKAHLEPARRAELSRAAAEPNGRVEP